MVPTVSVALGDCRQLFTDLESEFYCQNYRVYKAFTNWEPFWGTSETAQKNDLKNPQYRNFHKLKIILSGSAFVLTVALPGGKKLVKKSNVSMTYLQTNKCKAVAKTGQRRFFSLGFAHKLGFELSLAI
jgi:hypothetical protein